MYFLVCLLGALILASYTGLSVRQVLSRGHCVAFLQLYDFAGLFVGVVYKTLLSALLKNFPF